MTEPTGSWANWAGNVQCRPEQLRSAGDVGAVVGAVAAAAGRGLPLRVAGAGHSFAPLVATDGIVLDLAPLSGLERVDAARGEAWVGAGTRIADLGELLWDHGVALASQGDIDRQAIAGAVATGTHGTGRCFGSFSAMVRGLEVVTADGDVRWIDDTSPSGLLDAASLSLGLLGVVTRIALTVVPAYHLREQSRALPFDACLDAFGTVEATCRHAEFWWVPPLDTCVLKTLTETDDPPLAVAVEEAPPGTIERYLRPERVDRSYRIFPSTRSLPFVECEHTVPIDRGPDALRAVRAMMQRRYPEVVWSVEYRTQPGERSWLSPTAGADAVTISVHQAADRPWEAFMRDCDALLAEHGGRPHWGKLHGLTRERVDALYPRAEAFRELRRAWDPDGRFLNPHLAALFA